MNKNALKLAQLAKVLAVFISLIGLYHFMLWVWGDIDLRGSAAITMKTNGALSIFFLGLSLFLLTPAKPVNKNYLNLARLFAFLPLAFGFLTLLENIFGFNFFIDEIFIREAPGALGVDFPNRMGTPTSLAVMLAGVSLLCIADSSRVIALAQILGSMVAFIGFFGVIGYLYHIEPMFGIARYTAISFAGACALVLLGFAILLARSNESFMRVFTSPYNGSELARRLLLPYAFLAFVLGYVELVGKRSGFLDSGTGVGLLIITFIAVFVVILYRTAHELNMRSSAQRLAQEALVYKEAELSEAQRIAHFGSWNFDAKTQTVNASPETYLIQGLDPSKPFPKFREDHRDSYTLTQDSWDRLNAIVEKTLVDGQSYEIDLESKRPDGKSIWFTSRGEAVTDRKGNITGLRGTVQDITRRKKAEEQVRRSEHRYRTLFQAMDEGFCVVRLILNDAGETVDYRFLEANPAFEKHTGIDDDPAGKTVLELVPDHDREWFDIFGNVVKTGAPQRFEKFAPALGRWFDVYAFRLGLPEQHVVAILIKDITRRKNAEAAMQKANTELRDLTVNLEQRVKERTQQLQDLTARLRKLALELTESSQMERKRLAQMLHDHLQQLLVAIKIRLDLLARKAREEDKRAIDETRAFLDQAVQASRSLTSQLRPPVLYEGGLIAALRFLARKMEHQYKMKVVCSLSNDAEPQSEVTKAMLYECIQELLFNATKYAGVHECFLHLERHVPEQIIVTIWDKGVGFDPGAIGRPAEGGFGLFSIRERIQALGGEFNVSSSPGCGASFELKIPDTREIVHTHESDTDHEHAQEESLRQGKGNLRILLADDHKIVRQSLSNLLSAQPFVKEILEAEDGSDAVRLAKEKNPDIIIMDMNMPKLNGIEATRMINKMNPNLKVIGLSVQVEQETEKAMKDAGAIGYFNKADDAHVLIEALRAFAR